MRVLKLSDKITKSGSNVSNSGSVSVVIVSFQSAKVIERAIHSIGNDHEVICVDNASADNIAEVLAGKQIIHIQNETNLGYTRACNQGAEVATGDFILFMNPDVVLERGAIEVLLSAADCYPDADVFVPRTTRANGGLWYHDATKLEYNTKPAAVRLQGKVVGDCCIRFVDAGVFLIRRTTFRALGGFDENIFMYFEDDDFSLRLLAAGHTILHVNDALAVHIVGASSRPIMKYIFTKEFHKKRSEIYFNSKYKVPYFIEKDIWLTVAKIAVYCVTLRLKRALSAFGRLRGILSMRKPVQRGK